MRKLPPTGGSFCLLINFAVQVDGRATFDLEPLSDIIANNIRHSDRTVVLHVDNRFTVTEKCAVNYHVFKPMSYLIYVKIKGDRFVFTTTAEEYILKNSISYISTVGLVSAAGASSDNSVTALRGVNIAEIGVFDIHIDHHGAVRSGVEISHVY